MDDLEHLPWYAAVVGAKPFPIRPPSWPETQTGRGDLRESRDRWPLFRAEVRE